MNGIAEVLTPPSILTEIPIVSTDAELKLNRSFFTGRDIVPDQLQGLDAAQQFNDKTSSFSRVLGERLGVSPMKIDYAIGSQFGLWGRDLLAATTAAYANAPDPALEDTMFIRRFIKNADAGSQNGEFAVARARSMRAIRTSSTTRRRRSIWPACRRRSGRSSPCRVPRTRTASRPSMRTRSA